MTKLTKKLYNVEANYQAETLLTKTSFGAIPVAKAPATNAVRCVSLNSTPAAQKAAEELGAKAAELSGAFALSSHKITRFLRSAVLKSYELKDLAPVNGALARLTLPKYLAAIMRYVQGWGMECKRLEGRVVVTAIEDLKAQSELCKVMDTVNLFNLKVEKPAKEKADETAFSPVLSSLEKIEEAARKKFADEKGRGEKASAEVLTMQGNRAVFSQGAAEMLSFLADYIEAGHDAHEVMATAKAALEAAFAEQKKAAAALAPKKAQVVKAK